MIAIVDFGVFILLVGAAIFLGAVGMTLYRELKGGNNDQSKKS
jgi:hypothetical protein